MAAASNRYFLNGQDIFDTYGLFITDGSGDFLALPTRKASLSYDWPEENGVEIDLATPRFEDKEVILKMGFLVTSAASYWAKRLAFFQAIAATGWQTWRIIDHERDYSVRYVKSGNWQKTTKTLRNRDMVIVQFDLSLVISNEIQINVPGTGPALPVYVVDALNQPIMQVPSGGTLQIYSGFSFGLKIQTT